MSTPSSPFMDHAAPVLAGDPALTDEHRADLWDAFHGSKSPNELVQKLAPMAVPDDTKHRLFQAKQASMPVPATADKVTSAVDHIAQLDPQKREIAEAHPNLLKAFTAPEKAPQEAAGATNGSDKGTKTPKAPATPLAPRLDGQPHLPPIDESMHRILASDGGIHDIPRERIADAQKIDPNLHVLNP
jgi:hypothetical protein